MLQHSLNSIITENLRKRVKQFLSMYDAVRDNIKNKNKE
jgi:hypothetical protein